MSPPSTNLQSPIGNRQLEFLMSDALRALDLDVCDALRCDDFYGGVFITTVRPRLQTAAGVMQSQIEQLLGLLGGGRAGSFKPGAALIVDMPHVDVDKPNIPGPCLNVSVPIYCLTNPFYNFGDGGPGLAPELLGQRVLQNHSSVGYAGTTSAAVGPATNAMDKIPAAFYRDYGLKPEENVGYTARVFCIIPLPALTRAVPPALAVTGTGYPYTVTLTAAPGTTVFYSVDGLTYPGPANAAGNLYGSTGAIQYAAPVTIAAPCLLRFAAKIISDVTTLPSDVFARRFA